MTNESTRQHPFTDQSNESTPDINTHRNISWMRSHEYVNENPVNGIGIDGKDRNSAQTRDRSFRFFSTSSKNHSDSQNEENRLSSNGKYQNPKSEARNLSHGSPVHHLGSPDRYIDTEGKLDEDQPESETDTKRGEQKFFEITSTNIDRLLMEFKKELDTIKTISGNTSINHSSEIKGKYSHLTQQQVEETLQPNLTSPNIKDSENLKQFFDFRTTDTQVSSGVNDRYSQGIHSAKQSPSGIENSVNFPGTEYMSNLTAERQWLNKKGLVQQISDTNLYRMSTNHRSYSNYFQSPNALVKTINEIAPSTDGRHEKQGMDLFDSEEYYDDNDEDSTRVDNVHFSFATPILKFDRRASLDLERFKSTVESRARQKIEQFDNTISGKSLKQQQLTSQSRDSPSLKSLLKTPTKTDNSLGFTPVGQDSPNSEQVAERLSLENISLKNEVGRLAAQVTSLNTRVKGLEQQFENVLTLLKGRI